MALPEIDIYKDIVLQMTPRILGLGDRNPDSPTYGCFDRYYWRYKIIDFPNARFQEAALLLALLNKYDFPGNVYFQNPKVENWAKAAMRFGRKRQRRNGSFDEAYPFENSFVATAFGSFAFCEAAAVLVCDEFVKPLTRAGKWLLKNENLLVANQMAGAVGALFNLYHYTKEEAFLAGAEEKLKKLETMRDPAGYFMEYGGYDIGYLSLGLTYLSRYAGETGNPEAGQMVKKACSFIDSKIDEYGDYDSTITSRGTQYLYTYGFAQAREDGMIKKHINGLKNNRVLNPLWMDDRYCIHPTIDYLQTYLEYAHANDHR